MKLRPYQIEQINFLKQNTNGNYSKEIFKHNISIQSPTGSGKTFTAMQYISDLFKSRENTKVFFSTGFNNLVFQAKEEAERLGINCIVLIGRRNCNCFEEIVEQGEDPSIIPAFEENTRFKIGNRSCISCLSKNDCCLATWVLRRIQNTHSNLLVITNHSALLANEILFEQFNGGFIDECHTFEGFYQNHISLEIKPEEIIEFLNILARHGLSKSIEYMALKSAVTKGSVSLKLLRKAYNSLDSVRRWITDDEKPVIENIAKYIEKWNKISLDSSSFYERPQLEDGAFVGVYIEVFFDKINLFSNVCAISATVDSYTRRLLGINPLNMYTEKNYNEINYSDSSIRFYDGFTKENISEFISIQDGDHGLILSTRLEDVYHIARMRSIGDYEIIRSPLMFVDGKKQILVGSRKLFQGVDIQGLSFILLNKLPFQRYDVCYRKKMKYLETRGYSDTFSNYTIPSVTNSLIQSTGRLWRKPGDKGNIAIFDRKACSKHWRVVAEMLSYREGINVVVD